MSRIAWLLFFLCSAVLGHPGHDAPEPHLHQIGEVALFVAIALAAVVIFRVRRKRRSREDRKQIG